MSSEIDRIDRLVERKIYEGDFLIASLALAGLIAFLVVCANLAEAML